MASLHVLVVGDNIADNVCGVYRTGMYVPYLARLGVEVRFAMPEITDPTVEGLRDAERALLDGNGEFARLVGGWADVLVFRRGYLTNFHCVQCPFVSPDPEVAQAHIAATDHAVDVGRDWLVRALLLRVLNEANAFRGGIVYETDDDLLGIQQRNGAYELFAPEADFMRAVASAADLVTVSTPVLAGRLRDLNREVRVVRNAIDPAWYEGAAPRPAEGELRILYYGAVGRLHDYGICREAVDATARRHPGARRVWLGAPSYPDAWRRIGAVVDEVLPYVPGVELFARSLVEARPDIGVAPVLGDVFDRAKSELHWLEYAMAGAVTVASRSMEGGPYQVIRPGVDGLLARSKADWREALESLAASRDLRQELAGRARERVLAEYTAAVRAEEWAAAYRWAAEHAGVGRLGRPPIALAGATIRHAAPGAAVGATGAATAADPPPSVPAPAAAPPARAERHRPDPAALFAAYVAAQAFVGREPLLVHVDSGSRHLAGWVNVDRAQPADLCLDAAYGLPFPDASVDAIYAWRTIDRLGDLVPLFVAEAARALRPGGAIRVVARDREAVRIRLAKLTSEGLFVRGEAARVPEYDAAGLTLLLERAGFSSVRPVEVDASARAELAGLESRRGEPLPEDAVVLEALR